MWLHVPRECFPYAPATADLNSPLEWQELPPGLSLTSKGKPILLRTLRLLWKKATYLRLLSGMTWPRSRAAVGVAWWKSSLRASHASPSPQPGSDSTSRTSGGSGPTLSGFYATWSPEQSFWRTSQGSLFEDWDQCLERFPNWGSMRSGRLYVRATQMSAHHTLEQGSSSSRLTPSTDAPTDAPYWPTPDAGLYGGTNMGGAAGRVGAGRPALTKLAQLWPTPVTTDAHSAGGRTESAKKTGRTHAGTSLTDAMRLQPTPSARDHRSTCASEKTHERNARPLSEVVGLQAQEMKMGGGDGSLPVVLNPEFVETLLGLPTGWSAAACLETESSHSKPLTHSSSSGKG